MKLLKVAAVLSSALLVPAAALAAPVCAPLTGADSTYYAAGGGCNTLITYNADGTVSVTTPNANPYDGSEDNYVGVVNNSGSAISSIFLSGGAVDIFGFDGDGIDDYGIAGNATDTATYGSGAYGGTNAFFTGIGTGSTSGTVNFITPIANGSTGAFSLEEAPSLSSPIVVGGSAPEPGTIVLLGTGALGVVGSLRRRIFS